MKIIEGIIHIVLLIVFYIQTSKAVKWDRVRCSIDRSPVDEGVVPHEHIGRFPWLGVIQHDFYLYGQKRSYSVTGAVRIHASYALASAEDMAMINRKTISNTTHFIVWHSSELKYAIGIEDYFMHPEYVDRVTYATTALVELTLLESSQIGHPAPVLPICLPAKNHPPHPYEKIYVVKMTASGHFIYKLTEPNGTLSHECVCPVDTQPTIYLELFIITEDGIIQKEIYAMLQVDNNDCDTFYEKSELDFKMMLPTNPICAATVAQMPACVWDGGALLVTREPDNYWTLLGFGVRGLGCGAPARFIDVRSQLAWIDPQITANT